MHSPRVTLKMLGNVECFRDSRPAKLRFRVSRGADRGEEQHMITEWRYLVAWTGRATLSVRLFTCTRMVSCTTTRPEYGCNRRRKWLENWHTGHRQKNRLVSVGGPILTSGREAATVLISFGKRTCVFTKGRCKEDAIVESQRGNKPKHRQRNALLDSRQVQSAVFQMQSNPG